MSKEIAVCPRCGHDFTYDPSQQIYLKRGTRLETSEVGNDACACEYICEDCHAEESRRAGEQVEQKKEVEDFLNKGIIVHPSGESESLSVARGLLGS